MSNASWSSLPVAPGESLFGHFGPLRQDQIAFMQRLGPVGPLIRVRFLHRSALFVGSPEVAHQVLVTHASSFEKSPGIRLLLHDLGGEGLFTSEGEHWKRQRRLMSPLFSPTQVASYTQAMNAEARRALSRFRDGGQIDLASECTRIAMGVVGSTLFGTDSFAAADEISAALTTLLQWVNDTSAANGMTVQITLFEAVEFLRDRTQGRLHALLQKAQELLKEPLLLPGRRSPEMRRALKTLDDYVQAMIKERRGHTVSPKDLLTRLLLCRDSESATAEGGMTDKQLRDEVSTLFVAGHETTATALAWSFYLLARHPEARAQVQAEADAFGPEGPTGPEPQGLAYTTRVFKEALRLYPPVIFLARRALEPVEIGGVKLPTHSLVFISPLTLHYSPEIWPDPTRFDPDRHLPKNEAARHRSAWLPFGIGPRVCIGNHFALLEGPIIMATLMRRARFEIDPHREILPARFATPRPDGGVKATVRFMS